MDSIEKMKTSESWKNLKLQDLYKCPWFFGELSEENAKEILVEAKQNDENCSDFSECKTILFLRTGFDDIKENYFTIALGHLVQYDGFNDQPRFYFYEDYSVIIRAMLSCNKNLVMRKNPFSLQELGKVKTAASGVNPETLKLPMMIKDEVKKYQTVSDTSINNCIAEVQLSSKCFACSEARTTDARSGTRLHCTAENPLPLPNF